MVGSTFRCPEKMSSISPMKVPMRGRLIWSRTGHLLIAWNILLTKGHSLVSCRGRWEISLLSRARSLHMELNIGLEATMSSVSQKQDKDQRGGVRCIACCTAGVRGSAGI